MTMVLQAVVVLLSLLFGLSATLPEVVDLRSSGRPLLRFLGHGPSLVGAARRGAARGASAVSSCPGPSSPRASAPAPSAPALRASPRATRSSKSSSSLIPRTTSGRRVGRSHQRQGGGLSHGADSRGEPGWGGLDRGSAARCSAWLAATGADGPSPRASAPTPRDHFSATLPGWILPQWISSLPQLARLCRG